MNTFAIGSLPVHFSVAKLFTFRWQYTQSYEEDPVLLAIVGDLRDIECQIKAIVRQADTDFEDFDALKRIVETITI